MLKYTTGNAIAGCKNGNVKCICENEDFLNGIACCLTDACDDAGKAAAVKFAQQICSTAGVTVPEEVTCNNSSATESAAASASASSSSAAAAASGTTASEAAAGTASAPAVSSTSPAAAAGLGGAGVGGAVGAVLAMMMAL